MNVAEAITLFVRDRESYCSPKTVQYYREGLKYFQEWANASGIMELENLKTGILTDYQIYLRSRKAWNKKGALKNTSINTFMRCVRTFIHWLQDEDLYNSVAKFPKRLRNDADQVFVLTASEVVLIDGVIHDSAMDFKVSERLRTILYLRNYLIFHLMIDEGLRISEVVGLRIRDVDLEKNIVYVNKGKGSKDRIVPLAGKVKDKFKQLLELYGEDLGESAFYDYRLKKPLTLDMIKLFFSKIKKKSGVERIHSHLCRHTFATSFIMAGGDVSVLRVLLGHSDIIITQRYLHLAAQFTISKLDIYKLDPVFFQQ